MAFDPTIPPDPQGQDDAWDSLDLGRADVETTESDVVAREQAAFDAPDALDHLIEIVDMETMCAAQSLLRVNALRQDMLADAGRQGRALRDVIERSIRLEIATALRITENAAARMVSRSEALIYRYPAVLDSFRTARMTEWHADILIDTLDSLEPEFRDVILPRAVELAEAQPVGAFRRALRTLTDTVRAETLDERHEAALERRRVYVERADDAMAWVMLHLPAVEAHALFDRATRMAKAIAAHEGETRTLDQLRAELTGTATQPAG